MIVKEFAARAAVVVHVAWVEDATDPADLDVLAQDGFLEVVALDFPVLSGNIQTHFFRVTVGVAP